MARLVISRRAALDVSAIVAMLTDTAGSAVAARYRREFDSLFDRLVMFPRSGMQRPKLGHGIRIAVVSPYLIIYRYQPDIVTIFRVLDGRRDITRRLVRG